MFFFAGESNDKKAGKLVYPVPVGNVSSLYKTSQLSCKQLTTVDLHGLPRHEALEKLDMSLPVWVDIAMRAYER